MRARKNRVSYEEISRAEELLVESMQNTDGLYTREGKDRLKRYLQLLVGARCYEIQMANNMSNEDMAALIKKSKRTWIGIVGGYRAFKFEELIIIARRFNVGLDFFLKGFAAGKKFGENDSMESCDLQLINMADSIKTGGLRAASTSSLLLVIEACVEVLWFRYKRKL